MKKLVEIELFCVDYLKNQYNKNETFIFKKCQNSLKTKVPMPPKNAPLRTTIVTPPFDFLAKLEHQRLLADIKPTKDKRQCSHLHGLKVCGIGTKVLKNKKHCCALGDGLNTKSQKDPFI